MASFGLGLYFLTVIWFLTLMLCWVSVRTGHYIGKVALGITVTLSVILVTLPKGDVEYSHGANFYDKLFVPRYAVLALLLISCLLGLGYCFARECLSPIETKKVRTLGSVQ